MLSQLLVNSLVVGCGYGLVAVSFGLIYNTARFFHFAHGAVYTVGAYATLVFVTQTTIPTPLGIFLAISLSAVLGAGIEMCIHRPMRRIGSGPLIHLVASLGLLIAIQNGISLAFGDATRMLRAATSPESKAVFGAYITPIQMTTTAVSVSVSVALWAWLRWSRMGKVIRAVSNNTELAEAMGVDSNRVVALAFLVGSAIAGIAAILNGFDTDLTPMMGFRALLIGVVAMIIGGIGSIAGCFLGGLFIGTIQQVTAWILPTHWQDVPVFVVLVLFLLFMPKGFFGRPQRSVTV